MQLLWLYRRRPRRAHQRYEAVQSRMLQPLPKTGSQMLEPLRKTGSQRMIELLRKFLPLKMVEILEMMPLWKYHRAVLLLIGLPMARIVSGLPRWRNDVEDERLAVAVVYFGQ